MSPRLAARWFAFVCMVVPAMARPAEPGFPVDVRATSLVRGPRGRPSAVVELELRRPLGNGESLRLRTTAGGETTLLPPRNATGERLLVPVAFPTSRDSLSVTVELGTGSALPAASRSIRIARPETGWVLHLIPGFHYDPVWWNTQSNYTETGGRMGSDVGAGHTLVDAYLKWIARDRDATVALHQLPYLQTFIEARPWRARQLEGCVRSGRCALVGGTYDELSSTLVGPEAIVRNAVYGSLFQREVLGGDGRVAWQCDVFGHDPSFPSLMARTGHTAAAFARGPFHQWGAPRDQVDFPSEFLWMGPDGTSVLAHYMTGHYGYAYGPLAAAAADGSPARAEEAIARMFEDLKRPALTHHVMLPMHSDFIRPIDDLGTIVRAWNDTYVSPKLELSTPEDFFAAVRREIRDRKLAPPIITRDMNPIYTGCGVSFADLKQAERDCEAAVRDAEMLSTLAALRGAAFPEQSLDRAWRQLLFAAHHDAVTGSMSDQVYVDLLYVYRDALDLAHGVRDKALAFLASADPGDPHPTPADAVREGQPPAAPAGSTRRRLANEFLVAEIDLVHGGTLSSLRDARTGREFLRGAGNDVVLLPEYPNLPGHGEGPWHLAPTGERRAGTEVRARVVDPARRDPHSLVVEAAYPSFTKRQSYALRPGSPALEMTTEIVDWRGSDALLRVEFPVDAPGARPVFQTAAGVVGRPFARDVATADDPWTLDETCWGWVDLGTTCRLEVRDADRVVHARALGVGEIVVAAGARPADIESAGRLVRAFVRCGVTTTLTRADERRYGDLAFDSNVPDFRVAFGDQADVARALGLRDAVPSDGVPAYVEGDDAGLPVIVIADHRALETVIHDLATAHAVRIERRDAQVGRLQVLADRGIALLSRDAVSVHVTDGVLGLNLLRSCTGWPAGVWIDAPARRLPDGAPFETMHGSHRFQYALLPHAGDWRAAQLPERARDLRPLPAQVTITVEPAGVQLVAFKPEGFAAARWRTRFDAVPPATRFVVARLWNAMGEPVDSSVHVPQLAGKAWRADALETRGARLSIRDGAVQVSLEPFAYETIVCAVRAETGPAKPEKTAHSLEVAPTEDASAYWLENRGEGVTWNGIVSLAPEQRRVELVNGVGGARIAVANNHRSRRLTLHLEIDPDPDPGLRPRLDREMLDVAPGGSVSVLLLVEGPPGARGVRAPITVRARLAGDVDASWTTAVWFESADAPDEPPFEVVCDRPITGRAGRLQATLVNRTDVPVTGEATWLAPRILWDALPAWRHRVTVPARGSVEVSASVHEGVDSWALLRFTAAGKAAYGEPTAIVGDPERVLVRAAVDRVRVREGRTATLRVVARSLAGLTSSSRLALAATEGWTVRQLDRRYEQDAAGRRLESTLEVRGSTAAPAGTLTIAPSRGPAVQVGMLLVPVQRAAPLQALVRVDGDLAEWQEAEFTTAAGPLGRMRAAVRWGHDGLAVAIAVEDSTFVQTHTGAGLWEGDSVQLGFTVVPSDVIGYDAQVLEYGAARTPDGPTVWCWYGGAGGRTGKIPEAPLAVRTDSRWTRYEMLLPRAALPGLRLEPGSVLGFSYIANDDDGAGFRGATQWTRGMSGGKDASLFGDLVLEKE